MTDKVLDTVDETNAQQDAASEAYNPDNVQVLRDAAHIRKRPGNYIGDTGPKGLHHLVYELVYNSVDEALAGHCKNIQVKIHLDGSLSVTDDGRGIPVEMHPTEGKPTIEVVLTMVGAGAKFDKSTYKTSAGLHGMGAKAVNALSEWTEAEIRRGGKVFVQEYERGFATTPVKELGSSPGNRSGTKITFKPDQEIFGATTFEFDTLEMHLRELAFLNKGLAIKLTDERTAKEESFHAVGGVSEFVEYLNRTEAAVNKTIYVDRTVENVRVEIALQYTDGEEERVRCYANNAYNPGGGTHLSGFRSALTRALGNYGAKENMFKNATPTGEDFREGITAVVSVQVPEPQFESQTKIRLNNPEVDGYVQNVFYDYLTKYMEENPKEAQKILKKVLLAAEAREAAAKAKKALKDRKNILSGGGLPGKLMDCTSRDRDESELFLVEGQSAAGSADNGRDRHHQALLPLRGKVLNVEKARVEKVLGNEEICNLISAIGIDIGNTEEIEKLRYGKVILLTDADVDGQHIRTLLLTFFYRQMRKLIETGHIFVARPPLYKVEQKKHTRYVQRTEEMNRELLDRGIEGTALKVAPAENEPGKETLIYINERLRQVMEVLDDLERTLTILEKRGHNVLALLGRLRDGKLPGYRIMLGNQEHWRFSHDEVDAFRQELIAAGRHLIVADDTVKNGNGNGHGEIYSVQELHEIKGTKGINGGLEKLAGFGLKPSDLAPAPRVAGREPLPRFFLEADGKSQVLPDLRVLGAEVRKLGEKGIKVTRFKGLGEMDGNELWETTLDPAHRTLMKVQLDDALAADEMFRILMGDKVEPRRDFIQKHAQEVKDFDYHGG